MGALVNLLIGVTIAFLPLYTKVAKVDFSRVSKDNLLIIIMGVLCFLLHEKKRSLPTILYVALAYGLFSIVLNQWNPISLIVQFQTFYIAAGLIFFACYYERHSRDGLDYILNGMAAGCLIQCLIVFLSYFNIPAYFYFLKIFYNDIEIIGDMSSGIGSLGNQNLLASYVSITAIALLRKRWCWLLPVPLITLYISESIMGYAAFASGVIYFSNNHFNLLKKYWLYLTGISAMVLAFFTGLGGHDTKRFKAWAEIFRMVDLNHFLFGKGPGWFFDHGLIVSGPDKMVQEHNAYISVFNVFGIIGIGFLLPSFIRFLKEKDQSSIFPSVLFAAFISSYGHFTLHQSTVAIIIIVTAAICMAEGNKNVINMEW